MRIRGTTLALACIALTAWPCASAAQDDQGEPTTEAEAAAEAEPAQPTTEGSEDAPPGEVAVAATTAVGEQGAELPREQAEMGEEGRGRGRPTDDPDSLDHEFQVGLRFGAGVPFLFALRYGMGPQCDDEMSQFCVFVGSGIMDLDLSFGVTPDLEITLMGRYGMVGVEPTASNNILLGLGIRSYVSPESVVKGFFGVRAILDLTPAGSISSWNDVDAGVRGEAGLQVDIVRYVGLYAQIGVNITFIRALAIAPDVTGGLQLRVP